MKPNTRHAPEAWVAGPTYPGDYPQRYLDWLEKEFPDLDLASKEGRRITELEYPGWQEWMSNPARRTAVWLANPGCANPAKPARTMRFDSGLDR